MLYVKFGTMNVTRQTSLAYIDSPNSTFDANYEESWIKNNPFAERVIRGIDKCKIIDTHLIKSEELGYIPTDWLASGTKNLILAQQYSGVIHDGDKLGDNCWTYLLELSLIKDIQMTLFYHPRFEWVDGAKIVNIANGDVMTSFKEFGYKHRNAEDRCSRFNIDDVSWPIPLDHKLFRIDWDV